MYNNHLLHKNQKNAIQISINNDFKSGIHYHATGSGKSWIAMCILDEFNKKYPKSNVFWICERKDILVQQFSKKVLKDRNFYDIITKYNVLDFVNNKDSKWYDSINSSKFWGKPFLCIINRCFLTSKLKYENIKLSIDLVIHDECHSIENNSTNKFYTWLIKRNKEKFKIDSKIIGFSATPEKIYPLDNILSKYSIYDAYNDNVILPPKIVWVKFKNRYNADVLIKIIKQQLSVLPYKKIIVWCGVIEECIKLANLWVQYFKNFKICLDYNNIKLNDKFHNFEYFYNLENNGILFCAMKHREGSDIPNVDGCIFMDMLENRSRRVFIQSMGRVLRKDKDNKKKYGLIIDLKANSTIEICNRVQYYLELKNLFPWKYSFEKNQIDDTTYIINYLDMDKDNKVINTDLDLNKKYHRNEIQSYFIRKVPDIKIYKNRLDSELELIINKNMFGNILKAVEILEITKNIPHITRGSCGSSLVCYLLGISHVDPIKYNISFARFLNKYRDKLPDIDFDFPHYLRDEVFLRLYQKWGNKIARISNHNYYHEKSALRQALRINGINKFISKYEIYKEVESYDAELKNKIYQTQRELEGQFRGFSLHCGGIIYFPDGIPDEYLLDNNKSIIQQVNLNRDDISDNKNFKIDILSSCGLSQLYYCNRFNDINFNLHLGDINTIKLLSRGDNIGITLAESPLMRKALLLIKPKNILDLAICLSIIRPAAKDAKKEFESGTYNKNSIIFDDDVISVLSKLLNCEEDKADKIRRKFCKNDTQIIDIIEFYLSKKNKFQQNQIRNSLNNIRKYGFCKSHALSYAQLVWQLAYHKANNPKLFWESTLKNTNSHYRKWVHIYEANCYGIKNDTKDKSLYTKNKQKKIDMSIPPIEQLRKYGYWDMKGDEFYHDCYCFENNGFYIFKGLIASSRIINFGKTKKIAFFIGISKNKYIDVIVNNNYKYNGKSVLIKGKGLKKNNIIIVSYNNVNYI